MRGLARALLLVLMAASAFATWRAGLAVARDPALRPMVDAGLDQILAATDRMMAIEATPERMAGLITTRLTEDPRNWVALDALQEVMDERGIVLPTDLGTAMAAARAEDDSLTAQLGGCAACAWDIAQCSLSQAFACKAPILLTPVEDLRGIVKAGVDYSAGGEVDQLDLGLSVLGLSATALVIVSGGSSGAVKAGTALVRLARGMDLLSPRLTGRLVTALRRGIDWAGLPAVRSSDDLAGLVRMDVLAPVAAIASDLGRTSDAIGPARTLHLLPMIDDAVDARGVARAAEALGPRIVGRAEVLGKARLMRATVRAGSVATELVAGIVGLATGLGMAIGGVLQTALLRGLRRMVR
jgi:hypothetical protein